MSKSTRPHNTCAPPWSAHEDARAEAIRAAGGSYDDIAAELGRSRSSVKNRWYKLHGAGDRPTRRRGRKSVDRAPRGPVKTGVWSAWEDDELLNMRDEGLHWSDIAWRLQRERGAVQRRWAALTESRSETSTRLASHCLAVLWLRAMNRQGLLGLPYWPLAGLGPKS